MPNCIFQKKPVFGSTRFTLIWNNKWNDFTIHISTWKITRKYNTLMDKMASVVSNLKKVCEAIVKELLPSPGLSTPQRSLRDNIRV